MNNPINFVETDNNDELFITTDLCKNTSFVIEDRHNKVVIVLHSVINDYLEKSFVQHRY